MRHTNFVYMMLLIATFATLSRVAAGDTLLATRGQPVVERAHSVVVDVADGHATLTVRRTYENLGDVPEQVELSISSCPNAPWPPAFVSARRSDGATVI